MENKNAVEFMYNEEKQVRVVMKDGEPWFVAKDVCDALEIGNPSLAVNGRTRTNDDGTIYKSGGLDEDEKGIVTVNTLGGEQEMLCVSEPGLYKLIMSSRKPEAKPFQRWVTHEVLPDIRKTGTYSLQPENVQRFNLPHTYKEALLAIVAEVEKNENLQTEVLLLEQRVAEYEPKATYVDQILESKNTVAVTQIAKDYGLTAQRLNAILHEEHVQFKVNSQWVLYKEHQGLGYTKSHTFEYVDLLGVQMVKMHTEWTQKGRLFIHDILTKREIVPCMDREDAEIGNKIIDLTLFPSGRFN